MSFPLLLNIISLTGGTVLLSLALGWQIGLGIGLIALFLESS